MVRLGGGVSSTPGLASALAISLYTATISAAVITLLGVPLAYLLARGSGAVTRVLTALVALPLALPPLMSGLLLLYVVGPYTTTGRLFGGDLTDTRIGVVLAQTFVAAPFLVIAARATFAGVDPALEDVAACLGHGRFARFHRVAVRAALPGIAAGMLLAWLRAFGEFGATVILAYHPYTLPVFTYVQFDATGLPATMLPIAASLAAAMAILLLVQLPAPRRRRRNRHPPPVAPPLGENDKVALLDFALVKHFSDFTLHVAHRAQSAHVALLGASGAGKTLTLRLIAGLTRNEHGHTDADGRALAGLPPERRDIGYVPQHAALLPRRTVWQQVTFGVRASPASAGWWIERLGLQGLEDRYPDELSGGQQKRVSFARALANRPRVLLLDEPFTGLDTPVRRQLARELRRIQREGAISTVIVTHDPEEAAVLAEEMIVIGDGHVLQAGSRQAVYDAPGSPEVAALLGIPNTRRGTVLDAGRLVCEDVEIDADTSRLEPGLAIAWSVRPERIFVRPDGRYRARLLDRIDLGHTLELTVALAQTLELAVRTSHAQTETGDTLQLDIDPRDISVWAVAHAPVPAGSPADTV
ncbi:MAG: ABC transporter ATP-binding protein/permease [Solirubrobacteraceae bacterium]